MSGSRTSSTREALRLRVVAVGEGRMPTDQFKARGAHSLLVAVATRRLRVEGVSWRAVEVDGLDATDRALEAVRELGGADLVLQGSVAFAGFNVLDPLRLHEELGAPVIVVLSERPDNEAVYRALTKHFTDWEARWRVFKEVSERAPLVEATAPQGSPIYLAPIGLSVEEATSIVRGLTRRGRMPEPLRAAELIAKGISRSLYALLRGG